jgi:hypothetical protein
MSDRDRPTNEPLLEPTTSRTGGRSARVAALAIGALLVSSVYVGMSGGGAAPASPSAVAVAPTPAASAVAEATHPPLPTPAPDPPMATKPKELVFPNEEYQVTLRARGRTVQTEMYEVHPGVVSGLLIVPSLFRGETVSLEIKARPQADPLLGRLPVWSFDVRVPRRAKFQAPEPALDVFVPGSPRSSGVLGIESNGYRFVVTYALISGAPAINVVLFVNPNPADMSRRWVTGDDGLVGWPTALSR